MNNKEKKTTLKDSFLSIIKKGENKELLSQVDIDFLKSRIELLERKTSSKGQTTRQVENESYKKQIVDILATNAKDYTIGELETILNLSNQRITALLTQLINEDNPVIERQVIKKKAYYKYIKGTKKEEEE